MKKNDHVMLKFEIALFVFAVINLIWAIIKSIQYNWSLFNIKGIDILVAYAVSVYIFHFSIRELMYFKKHKKIEHGYDERNIKVLDKSLRNVAITMFLIMMGSFYYFYLFNKADTLLFNLASMNWVFAPALIVFFLSFNFYSKSKDV